jgi:hypothetical protein
LSARKKTAVFPGAAKTPEIGLKSLRIINIFPPWCRFSGGILPPEAESNIILLPPEPIRPLLHFFLWAVVRSCQQEQPTGRSGGQMAQVASATMAFSRRENWAAVARRSAGRPFPIEIFNQA